ncbi:hypothetical protein ACRAWG_36520 [Methylobacterium sp. P31]
MRFLTAATAMAVVTLVGVGPVEAKGCIKGAIIGGAAGHYLANHHGVIGAVVGCIAGRYGASRGAGNRQNYDQGYAPTRGSYGDPGIRRDGYGY